MITYEDPKWTEITSQLHVTPTRSLAVENYDLKLLAPFCADVNGRGDLELQLLNQQTVCNFYSVHLNTLRPPL